MIKDILVNLSYGTSQDGVSNYALSIAEQFGAHIVEIVFEAQERAKSVAAAFDGATRRAGVSAENAQD